MEFLTILFVVLCLCCPHLSQQQRVAPGVPPQHYDPNLHQQQQYMQQPPPPQYQQQQQPPPPQYQQQQQVPQQQFQQQQQVPIQHQQVPVAQIPQQQVPHGHGGPPVQPQIPVQQQAPQAGGHGHGHAHGHGSSIGGGQPILDSAQIAQERQHIQEHMDVPIDTSQMSEQELQFHYFKMHDADNNNKLDGCELVKSLIHWHDQSNHDQRSGAPIPEAKIFKDEELTNMIDPILENDDKNKDGFIDYAEFVQAQATAAAKATPTQTV